MSFSQFLNSPVVSYLLSVAMIVLLGVVGQLLHNGIKRLEGYLDARVTPDDAVKINDFLDAVDRLAGLAVQDASSRMVVDLKANGLFNKEVAASVKNAVVQDVIKNLGSLGAKATPALGPIENIVAHAVEKHVFVNKQQTNSAVQMAVAKSIATPPATMPVANQAAANTTNGQG